MQEEFGFGREVEVDDVIQERNVNSSSCEIGDDEYVCSSVFKSLDVHASCCRIQRAVRDGTGKSRLPQHLKD